MLYIKVLKVYWKEIFNVGRYTIFYLGHFFPFSLKEIVDIRRLYTNYKVK